MIKPINLFGLISILGLSIAFADDTLYKSLVVNQPVKVVGGIYQGCTGQVVSTEDLKESDDVSFTERAVTVDLICFEDGQKKDYKFLTEKIEADYLAPLRDNGDFK